MNEINKFRIWARRSGLWTLEQINSLEDTGDPMQWESEFDTLKTACEAWMYANEEEYNGDYQEFMLRMYDVGLDDEDAEWIETEDGDIEFAHPAYYAGYLAWKYRYNG